MSIGGIFVANRKILGIKISTFSFMRYRQLIVDTPELVLNIRYVILRLSIRSY